MALQLLQKGEDNIDGGYAKRMNALRPFIKKCEEIRKKNNNNIQNKIKEFIKNSNDTFIVFADEFMDWEIRQGFLKEDKKKLEKDLSKLIKFFKGKKTTKQKFINFFKKDICLKNKDLIFYNGFFMKKPSQSKRINPFRSQEQTII